ncbi:hypothetical protein [Terriglobus roseus]|uniref:Uncharacterized protein n=1 Tax=Terriglobus roseus TaxID=392734 RepID=A0A1H4Q0N6_9BACT|nr:hypothetical protein [Terriglobus roseus]SEC13169.1 hypothetical protein SAMN05443244_2731 [Terriglobus roseus]
MTPHRQLRSLHRQLRAAAAIVPSVKREAWQTEWVAELSHAYCEDPHAAAQLAQGLVPDAIAMRRLQLRCRFEAIDWRAPSLCVRMVGGAFFLLFVCSMAQPQLRHLVFSNWGHGAFACFIALALFSLPSTVVTSRYGACDAYRGDAATMAQRWLRWRFLGAKLVFAVLSCYLLAIHVTMPFQHLLGAQADWLLMACGLVFNVVAVSWALTDQRQRCPTCMRSLRSPARMGSPSWSLLDSNATEEMCDRGHGLLHQPEWQTSWFENARWLQLDRTWRELFRP